MKLPESASKSGSLAHRFNHAWKNTDRPPDVFSFLASQESNKVKERVDAIVVDQIRRWQCGQAVPVERYFEAFPDVASNNAFRLELVYTELRLLRETWTSSTPEPLPQLPDVKKN